MKDGRLKERLEMVETQIKKRGPFPEEILRALRNIPRHLFVPAESQAQAYEDGPLPIGYGQTISQPYIVAVMMALIRPNKTDKVLEVGMGSGYSAALLSQLVDKVFVVEREASFLAPARERFKLLDIENVEVRKGDGTLGWPEEAPFDTILVAAGSPRVPSALAQQLKIGGLLVVPVGGRQEQELLQVVRESESRFKENKCGSVRFVPLVGKEGWNPSHL